MVKALIKSKQELLEELGDGVEETLDPGLKRAFDMADNKDVPVETIKPENVALKPGMFRISGDGTFYTLQGEGETMGRPCVFLRLHVCNLKCVWCDAWYTWNPKTPEFWTESKLLTVEEVKQKLEDTWACSNPNLTHRAIITGGEPMLHKDRIDKLMKLMPDWLFEIETNGTIMPTEYMLKQAKRWIKDGNLFFPRLQYNCSPKLSNSGNAKQAMYKPDVIKAMRDVGTMFKFVVMRNEDLDEIEKEWVEGIGIPLNQVCLMPQGVTAKEVEHNMQNIAEYAKEKGYRVLGRLQNQIWGARRGV